MTEKKEGNNNAMRDALLAIKEDIFKRRSEYQWYISDSEALKKIDAALAAPPRNCDVGTAEEQEVRFRNYCWNHSSRDKNMECQCPIDTEGKAGCKLEWAQLPYESEACNGR